jgi:predicted DNA-binding protein (MmcQ/YjbR family)
MYEDDDLGLPELREVCLALPEATEVESWGRPTFRAGPKGKIFATYGAANEQPHSVIFKPDDDERPALVQDPRIFVPPYYGPSGWLALDFEAAPPDWEEIAELMETSYRHVALKRQLKALDEHQEH